MSGRFLEPWVCLDSNLRLLPGQVHRCRQKCPGRIALKGV